MSNAIKIALGGKEFEVPRLTLRQLRDLEIGVIKTQEQRAIAEAGGEGVTLSTAVSRAYESNAAIVAAGLSRKYPEMTEAAIFDLETTNAEVLAAANAILDFAGMKGTSKGEAESPEKTGE